MLHIIIEYRCLNVKFLKFLAVFPVPKFSKLYLYDRGALRNCCSVRGDGAHLHCLLSCTLAFMDLEYNHDDDDDDYYEILFA